MTFLPIAERELRVAARKRGTYWGRLLPAGLALIAWGFLTAVPFIGIWSSPGAFQFFFLKWLAFLYACSVGLFITADSLSEEKREGTLGLLFLTDLRGYDVVAGKLLSHSVPAFYGLIAAFPILAIPLLTGGLTGSEFWRTMLALANTMFLSLSLGLLVSSVSRNAIRALNGTLFLTLALVAGLPLLDLVLRASRIVHFETFFNVASPWNLFASISAYRVKGFWLELGLQHLMGWGFLALACVITPRTWQEKSRVIAKTQRPAFSTLRRSGTRARTALLDKQPIFWLAARDRPLYKLIWSLTILLAVIYVGSVLRFQNPTQVIAVFGPIHSLINFVLVVWTAAQACRFFSEGRRNGALELILVSPVSAAEIVAGQWAALKRLVVWPTVALTIVYLAGSLFQAEMSGTGGWSVGWWVIDQFQGVNMIDGAVSRIANAVAVAWFGMWLGLTERKASIAIIKTFCYVIVIPALVITFLRFIPYVILSLARNESAWWITTVISMFLTVAKDGVFIFVARAKLLAHFREIVALDGGRAVRSKPPVWAANLQPPPLPARPPVIQ